MLGKCGNDDETSKHSSAAVDETSKHSSVAVAQLKWMSFIPPTSDNNAHEYEVQEIREIILHSNNI